MSLRDITNFTSHMSKKKQEEISRRVTERERERERELIQFTKWQIKYTSQCIV